MFWFGRSLSAEAPRNLTWLNCLDPHCSLIETLNPNLNLQTGPVLDTLSQLDDLVQSSVGNSRSRVLVAEPLQGLGLAVQVCDAAYMDNVCSRHCRSFSFFRPLTGVPFGCSKAKQPRRPEPSTSLPICICIHIPQHPTSLNRDCPKRPPPFLGNRKP